LKEKYMSIAILGTGSMAKGLAQRFAESEFSVVLGSRDVERAHTTAAQIGNGVQAASIRGAAQSADIIVLAVPYDSAKDTLAAAGDLTGKIVIDITNPLNADYSGLTVGFETSAAEEIQKAAPGAKVVKALNTIFAQLLAHPVINGAPITAFYAGDDEGANAQVRAILERAGFKPEFAGGLRNARYLEPLAGLNIVLGYGLGGGAAIAPEWRRAA
jgi:8-hydroxy-5-deazaflavin:NADPH oxidoreductase